MSSEKLAKGFKRKWVQCKRCKGVYYRDYQPYSLSNPIITMSCGHSYREDTIHITAAEAAEIKKRQENTLGKKKVDSKRNRYYNRLEEIKWYLLDRRDDIRTAQGKLRTTIEELEKIHLTIGVILEDVHDIKFFFKPPQKVRRTKKNEKV